MEKIKEFEKVVARLVIFRSVFKIMSWLFFAVVLMSLINTYSTSMAMVGVLYMIVYSIVDMKIKNRTIYYLKICHEKYKQE